MHLILNGYFRNNIGYERYNRYILQLVTSLQSPINLSLLNILFWGDNPQSPKLHAQVNVLDLYLDMSTKI